MPKCLHVGAGKVPIHPFFSDYEEIRLDLDPECGADIVAPMDDLPLHDMTVDAVYASHTLEHVHYHDALRALKEFRRVLMPGGIAVVVVPDVGAAIAAIANGDIYEKLYDSAGGPVRAADILWGHQDWIEKDQEHGYRWAHKFGYTADTLGKALATAGFENIRTQSIDLNAIAIGEA